MAVLFCRGCDEVQERAKRASEQREDQPWPNVPLLLLGVMPHPRHDQRQGDDQVDEYLHGPQAVSDRPQDARNAFLPNGGGRESPEGCQGEKQDGFEHAGPFKTCHCARRHESLQLPGRSLQRCRAVIQ